MAIRGLSIEELVEKKKWETLINTYLPITIAVSFSFEKGMLIAGELLKASSHVTKKSGTWAIFTQEYCVNLMRMLRIKYSQQWQSDWKNEAFLGITCSLVYRDEEAFKYIQNAYQRLEDPPQSLILAYLLAGDTPNTFLPTEKVDKLTHKALNMGVTCESAQQAASVAFSNGDQAQEKFWRKKTQEADSKGVHTPNIIPDTLEENKCSSSFQGLKKK